MSFADAITRFLLFSMPPPLDTLTRVTGSPPLSLMFAMPYAMPLFCCRRCFDAPLRFTMMPPCYAACLRRLCAIDYACRYLSLTLRCCCYFRRADARAAVDATMLASMPCFCGAQRGAMLSYAPCVICRARRWRAVALAAERKYLCHCLEMPRAACAAQPPR